jgi:hypothetical protein
MAKPGEYDFVPLGSDHFFLGSALTTLSVGIFRWIYTKDGHGLKKSKTIYRVKGPASKWQEINERARFLCDLWNSDCFDEILPKKSETL